jgi:alanine racemase
MKSKINHAPSHFRRTHADVDLRRIQHNFHAFEKLLPAGTFLCPMVKANAYGHGACEVTAALRAAGSKAVGVALVEEGEKIRRSGDREEILVFGPVDTVAAEAALRETLTIVASDWSHLESLEAAASRLGSSSVRIHLEFNTGMNRLGFDVKEANKLEEWVRNHKEFILDGVCTHLLRGNDAGNEGGESESQFRRFARAVTEFSSHPNLKVHALNSSASINLWKRVSDSESLGDGVTWPLGARPGIGLYGCEPPTDEDTKIGLKPALSLKSHLVAIHRVEMGARVSYGPTWTAGSPTTVGVLPLGYADGYRRSLSNKASVLYRGHRCPQIGTVCMDYFMIDITEAEASGPPAKLGEEVVLIGEQGQEVITPQEMAEWAGTIPYEILTGIGERVPRVYIR